MEPDDLVVTDSVAAKSGKVAAGEVLHHRVKGVAADDNRTSPRGGEGENERDAQTDDRCEPADDQQTAEANVHGEHAGVCYQGAAADEQGDHVQVRQLPGRQRLAALGGLR